MTGASAGPDAEHDRDRAHDTLRLCAAVAIAHDSAADDHADAADHALHRAKEQQRAESRRQRAAGRSEGVEQQAGEHDAAASDGVGERAMEQRHAGVGHQVDGQCLLDLEIADAELDRHRAHRRKECVDGVRAECREQREHQRHARWAAAGHCAGRRFPARRCECGSWRVHPAPRRSELSHCCGDSPRSSTSTNAEPTTHAVDGSAQTLAPVRASGCQIPRTPALLPRRARARDSRARRRAWRRCGRSCRSSSPRRRIPGSPRTGAPAAPAASPASPSAPARVHVASSAARSVALSSSGRSGTMKPQTRPLRRSPARAAR